MQWNSHLSVNVDEAGFKSGIIGTVFKGSENVGRRLLQGTS